MTPLDQNNPANWPDSQPANFDRMNPPVAYVPPLAPPKCPRCGAAMALRTGPRGEFYGCSSYPTCRGIVDAAEWKKLQEAKR